MTSIAYDLKYLRAAVDNLESYLLAPEVFWNLSIQPPPGEPPYPALSLGGILLFRQRMLRRNLSLPEEAEYLSLCQQLDVMQNRWRTAWDKKAAKSYQARLTQWRNFLEDYRHDPAGNVDRYRSEARMRVMLELLDQNNPYIPPEQRQLLAVLDSYLAARLRPTSFIWEEEIQPSFPKDQFEYLYGELIAEDENSNSDHW